MPFATQTDYDPSESLTRDELILRVLAQLQRLVRDSRAGFKAVAGEHGLTYYQGSTLVLIHRRGGVLNMSEIAEALHMSPSTVTSIVQALLNRELLERELAIDDRRSVIATLTASGAAIAGLIVESLNRAFAERFDGIPSEDIRPFLDVLAAVTGPDAGPV